MFRTLLRSAAVLTALSVPAFAQGNSVSFQSIGTGCGPTLAGSFDTIGQGNGLRLDLEITTVNPNAIVGVLIGGPSPLQNPFPIDFIFGQSFGCTLGVDPIFAQTHQASGNTYRWSRSLGSWFGTATAQFVESATVNGVIEVRTTNVIQLTRPAS